MLVPYRWLHERGRGVRGVVVATAGALSFGLMAAAPAQATPTPSPTAPDSGDPVQASQQRVDERPDAVSAMVTAQAQGSPVEDVSQRTETTRTFANPDGTWSTEVAAGPVRVRNADGSWSPIDTTLEQRPSGEWVPRAVAAEVSFSDGGNQPFATMEPTSDTSMGLQWPERLPEPVVEGSTLTYPDVVPGGDLVVQAQPAGFSHEIVLHDAPAGPVDYEIPLALDGLNLVEESSGALSVRTDGGREVSSAPKPLAWDRKDGRGQSADTIVPLQTSVDSTGANAQMVLTPDAEVLQDPDTQYPVTIDPTFSRTPFRDTWVQNADYTTAQTGSPELRAGTYDGGGHKARSFVDFDTAALKGKHILSATLKLRNYYSGSCTAANIRVNAIEEGWTKDGLTWGNQPGVYPGNYDDYAQAYGYTGCPGAGWATWNVREIVERWANGTWVNRGVRLKAVDETNIHSWRKYRSANYSDANVRPHLVVDYNSFPNTPGTPSVSPVAGSTSSGLVTKSATPTLSAKVSDPDGGKVRGFFEVRNGAGTLVWSKASALVASGSTASVSVPAGELSNGTTYTVKAFADDDTNRSKNASSTSLTVDTQAPATPAVTSSAYTDGAWRDDRPASNTFTFSSTAGDVTAFSYAQDGGAWLTKTANSAGEASLSWNPADGAHTLKVKATDKAGNTSAVRTFTFGVGGAELGLPQQDERSTTTFDVGATAPGGATGARLQWRLAGDPDAAWSTAREVTHADTGQPWLGEVTSSDGASRAEDLVWDASTEASVPSPGLLQLQMCFDYSGGQENCSDPREVHTVPHAFGSSFPTSELGAGQVGLFTGELQVSATDVEVPTDTTPLTLGRSHLSLSGRPSSPAAAVFGPGWTADLAGPATGAAGFTVVDRTAEDGSLTLQAPWGASFVYQHESGGRGAQLAGLYVGVGETATFDDTLRLSTGGSGTATHTLQLTGPEGTTTTWERTPAGEWQLVEVAEPQQQGTTRYAYNGDGLVTWVFAPAPAGITCTATTQEPGCRALNLSYTSINAAPRLSSVDLVAYDSQAGADGRPTAAAGMSRTTVARYDYTADGLLAAAWDPRLGDGEQALKTTYTYNQTGSRTQLATVTPPGEATWTYAYDTNGRVTSVQRPRPDGADTSTWTVGYDVATSGPGLPDLRPEATAAWGQNETDAPLAGAAVWAPDHVPATTPVADDYAFADLFYFSAAGRTTNTAGYGAGAWQVDTTWYDAQGNPVRGLSPANRNRALASTDSATTAEELSAFTTYNATGTRVEEEWGPTREIVLEDGSTLVGRDHTSYLYDGETTDPELLAGRPDNAPAEGYDLVVEETHSVSDTERTSDYDPDTIRYGYAPIAPGDGNGWTLRTPTTTRTQMEDGSWSVQTTRYDPAGRLVETRQPGGGADADGRGTDPKSYRIAYYTADDSAADPACDNQPQWAGMPCTAGPADQPATGKPLPVAHTVGYGYLLTPTRVEERSGELTRTTVNELDPAGRPTRTSVQVSNAPAGDQPIPDKTYAYDPATGQLATQQAGNDRIEIGYDSWGQQARYTTSTGDQHTNTATTTYDAVGRVKTFDDGKGTYTYTYDGTDAQGQTERRGLVTSVDVGLPSGPDTFTVAYDGDGAVAQMRYPNDTIARWDHTPSGDTTGLTYSRAGEELLGFTAAVDAAGRTRVSGGPTSGQTYRYDNLDRLTRVEDTHNDTCTTRDYRFDADSNRTALTTYPSAADGACTTGTAGDTQTSSFDEADRITDPGYSYDNLGRTRTVPAADTNQPTAGQLEVAYHANDMVASLTQTGIPNGSGGTLTQTQTFTLDAADRLRQVTDTTSGIGETRRIVNHYAGPTDSPAWIATSTDAGNTWSWERNILTPLGGLGMLQSSQGATNIQLTNPHGDVVATMANDTTSGVTSFGEATEYGNPRDPATAPPRYGWLGAAQRSSDALGGLTLMGARLYNPATGRFLTLDPVVGGNANPYVYPADPVNVYDLDGNWGCGWCKKAGGWIWKHKGDIALTAAGFVPGLGAGVWVYRGYRVYRFAKAAHAARGIRSGVRARRPTAWLAGRMWVGRRGIRGRARNGAPMYSKGRRSWRGSKKKGRYGRSSNLSYGNRGDHDYFNFHVNHRSRFRR